MRKAQDLPAQLLIHFPLSDAFPHALQIVATIRRVVHELLIVEHLVDCIIQLVLSEKLIVVEERNREAVRDDDARNPRLHHLAEVGRLRAVGDDI